MIKKLMMLAIIMCAMPSVMIASDNDDKNRYGAKVDYDSDCENITLAKNSLLSAAVGAGSGWAAIKVSDWIATTWISKKIQKLAEANEGSRIGYYTQCVNSSLTWASRALVFYGMHHVTQKITGTKLSAKTFAICAVGTSAAEDGYRSYRREHKPMTPAQIEAALTKKTNL